MRQKIHKSLFLRGKPEKQNLIGRKESEMEEKLSVLCVKVREKPKRIAALESAEQKLLKKSNQ